MFLYVLYLCNKTLKLILVYIFALNYVSVFHLIIHVTSSLVVGQQTFCHGFDALFHRQDNSGCYTDPEPLDVLQVVYRFSKPTGSIIGIMNKTEMLYVMLYSTPFIYDYIASNVVNDHLDNERSNLLVSLLGHFS